MQHPRTFGVLAALVLSIVFASFGHTGFVQLAHAESEGGGGGGDGGGSGGSGGGGSSGGGDSGGGGGGGHGSHSGHGTNSWFAMARWLADHDGIGAGQNGAFGGSEYVPLTQQEHDYLCSMKVALSRGSGDVRDVLTSFIANMLSRPVPVIDQALRDPEFCAK